MFKSKKEALANLPLVSVYPNMRPQQILALKSIINNIDKKYFICQLDVGIGKSGIAMTLANLCDSTYILSSTKQLQDQYQRDFEASQKIASIKGKSNYPCFYNEQFNCENGPCNFFDKASANSFLKRYPCFKSCHYVKAKIKAQNSPITVTSYQYLLRAFGNEGTGWGARDLIVLDEAHLLEKELLNFSEFEINPKELNEKFDLFKGFQTKCMAPFTEEGYDANKSRIDEIYNIIQKKHSLLFEGVKKLYAEDNVNIDSPDDLSFEDRERIKGANKDFFELNKFIKKINLFREAIKIDPKSWMVTPVKVKNTDATCTILKCSPLFMHGLFDFFMKKMANKFIFMSATILDTQAFIKELGLPQNEVYTIKIDSPFDPAKSPIYLRGFFDMKLSELDNSLPKLLKEVENIMRKYPNNKGIIHTGNYKIAKYIYSHIEKSLWKRILYKTDSELSNELLLKQHMYMKNTVLLSPSMTTGVDLKDDLARFQIICKLPYMSLGDVRIKIKSKLLPNWYNTEMMNDLVQATGRATRSENDYSDTYILDGKAPIVVSQYANMLSSFFIKRFQIEK